MFTTISSLYFVKSGDDFFAFMRSLSFLFLFFPYPIIILIFRFVNENLVCLVNHESPPRTRLLIFYSSTHSLPTYQFPLPLAFYPLPFFLTNQIYPVKCVAYFIGTNRTNKTNKTIFFLTSALTCLFACIQYLHPPFFILPPFAGSWEPIFFSLNCW